MAHKLALYKEIWKTSSPTGLPPYESKTCNPDNLFEKMQTQAVPNFAIEISYFNTLNKSVGAAILKSFLEMGLASLSNMNNFDSQDIMSAFKIQANSQTNRLINWLLQILLDDGFLVLSKKEGGGMDDKFKVASNGFPTLDELTTTIANTSVNLGNHFRLEWDYSRRFCAAMEPVLKGTCSAVELFSEVDGSFEGFFQNCVLAKELNNQVGHVLQMLIEFRYNSRQNELRILEVGARTVIVTGKMFSILGKLGIPYQYTITDTSFTDLDLAKIFFKGSPNIDYKLLNLEIDPLLQNFAPCYYDIVIACNVLHVGGELEETLKNVRRILKPSGQLISAEIFIPQRYLDVTLGHLDGNQRQDYPEFAEAHDMKESEDILKLLGFPDVTSFPIFYGQAGAIVCQNRGKSPQMMPNPNPPSWFLFTDESNKFATDFVQQFQSLSGKSVAILPLRNKPYNKQNVHRLIQRLKQIRPDPTGIEGLLYMRDFSNATVSIDHSLDYLAFLQAILKYVDANLNQIKVILTMHQVFDVDDQQEINPIGAELVGMTKVFASENPKIQVKIVDIGSSDDLNNHLVQECFTGFSNLNVAYRNGLRCTNSIIRSDFVSAYPRLKLPQESSSFHLKLPESRDIQDLSFVPISTDSVMVTGHNIRIQVLSSAVNFRDGFIIMGAFSPKDVTVCCNIAGIVVGIGENVSRLKVGDAVCSVRPGIQPLPSIAVMDEREVARIPRSITFEQAATLTDGFFTAYHCLVTLGKLRENETILIHTASGGVGLCSIQIAKHLKANIIATAGSLRKRQYLEMIGIQHVFNSRTLEFEDKVKQVTNNKGVNMVLNSLTGSGWKEATLCCLGRNGRFIEMSKINVWTINEVQNLRPDVMYKLIDFSVYEANQWRLLAHQFERFMFNGWIKPIPYTLFDLGDIREAITMTKRARHVGKIALKFPEHQNEMAKLFNSRSTYIITGGTRGIGLAVACWMVEHGARFLIMVGLSERCQETLDTIDDLERKGCTIHPALFDVGDYSKCKQLFENIRISEKFPPIRGIMHLAGSSCDMEILSQNRETFEICLGSKLVGSWNLHELTKDMPLEYFVLFSSLSAILGSPGQSNYAAGDSFMDSLASYRNSLGLPALSINWGQWGEEAMSGEQNIHGPNYISTAEGLEALEHLLRGNVNRACVSVEESAREIL